MTGLLRVTRSRTMLRVGETALPGLSEAKAHELDGANR